MAEYRSQLPDLKRFIQQRATIDHDSLGIVLSLCRQLEETHFLQLQERDDTIKGLKETLDVKDTMVERLERELEIAYEKMVNAKADLELERRQHGTNREE